MIATAEGPVIETEHEADAQPVCGWLRRRRWQALVGAVALAGSAIAATTWRGRDGEDLPRKSPEVSYKLFDMEPTDADFSMGDFWIEEPGQRIEIVSVKALISPNVEYLGAYVVWPRDVPKGRLSFGPGFPYPDQKVRHRLDEVIPASETAYTTPGEAEPEYPTVTLGFRVLSGMGGVNGIHVTYKANGKTKRKYLSVSAIACVKPLNCDDRRAAGGPFDFGAAFRQLDLVRKA